jgi:DNA gyrase subunit B
MYLDGVTPMALLELALHAALWEARRGRVTRIRVTLADDGAIAVDDDSDGLPDRVDSRTGRWYGITFVTELMVGGTFRELWLAVVSALSSEFVLESAHAGRLLRVSTWQGVWDEQLLEEATSRSGLTLRFRPDPEIFAEVLIDPLALCARLEELACLLSPTTIAFQSTQLERIFHAPRGAQQLLPGGVSTSANSEDFAVQLVVAPPSGRGRRTYLEYNRTPEADTLLDLAMGSRPLDAVLVLRGYAPKFWFRRNVQLFKSAELAHALAGLIGEIDSRRDLDGAADE